MFIDEFHMLMPGDRVVAGVSGGADSVCLLRILAELSREIGFSLEAVHVEHGIRGEESRGDAAFTRELCRNLDISLTLYSVDVPGYREETGGSMEEAARELRWDCFQQTCSLHGANRLALAHHAEDCAETMLFHLSRGTGIRGLCGIRPVSERSAFTVIRPLLCVTRGEIEAWLDGCGQAYRTDSTNTDAAYARNRIRNRVLPELEEINGQAVPHMLQLSGQLAEVCDYLDEAAREAGQNIVTVRADAENDDGTEDKDSTLPGTIVISCAPFTDLHTALQKHLILQLLAQAAGSRKDITSLHVERVISLMTADVGVKASLPYGITAEKTYESVLLYRGDFAALPLPETDLNIPGETVTENGLHFSAQIMDFTDFSEKIPAKPYTKWFDYDKIKFAVRLRGRHPGDYLMTDAEGGHKKLKKFFIDEKVPLSERDRICLLADGDHIMWVVGYRISEAYKVTEETKRVLCIDVKTQRPDGGND